MARCQVSRKPGRHALVRTISWPEPRGRRSLRRPKSERRRIGHCHATHPRRARPPMAITPTSTCPHWCEYHKNDPIKPDDFDHTARFTVDLALGRNSQFQSTLDVKIIQASYGDGPGEIWFDCW